MPSADLMFLFDAVLVDMGSCYMGKDEETEGIHWLYWLMVGRHRSDRSWVDGITYASLMLPHLDGKHFCAASGAKKPPTGQRAINVFIAASVQHKLDTEFGLESWLDFNGERHLYTAHRGVGGPLPSPGVDTQRTGRAVLREDLERILFSDPSSVKCQNPSPLALSPEKFATQEAIRKDQLDSDTVAGVLKANYKKKEMFRDLMEYNEAAMKPKLWP